MQYAQPHCCQCQHQHHHQHQHHQRQQQQVAVSNTHPGDMTFPLYLQTQLANWRPFDNQQQALQAPSQLPTQTQYAHEGHHQASIDMKPDLLACSGGSSFDAHHDSHPSYQQQHQPSQLKSFGSLSEHGSCQPGFFDDNFHSHRPQEAALYNPQYQQQYVRHSGQPIPTDFAMPHLPVHGLPHRASTDSLRNDANAMPPLSPLTSWVSNVDTSQYEVINSEDLKRGSFAAFGDDYDTADSPTSVDTQSTGPFTPNGSDFGTFDGAVPRTWNDLGTSFGSNTSDMFSLSNGLPTFHPSQPSKLHEYKPGYLTQDPPFHQDLMRGHIPYPTAILPSQITVTTATLRDLHRVPIIEPTDDRHDANPTSTDNSAQEEEEYIQAAEDRRRRDHFLLSMRERGYSYREIKRRGKFREAESTLRGRVRVLTKDKSERVRRPEWTDADIRLLHRAVAHHQQRANSGKLGQVRDGKTPWKRISVWIKDHGGSYLFAPATCAKKWEEVEEEEDEDE